MKKISILIVVFMFSFLCFSLNVNAETIINIDEFSIKQVLLQENTYYYPFYQGDYNTDFGFSNLFWSKESEVYNGNLELIYDDDVYNSISSNYKKYYDFKHFIYNGYPMYSIINLRLGNWKGYSSSINLVYCYDNVCNDSVEKSIDYKYGIDTDVIDLKDSLDLKSNGYSLDLTRDYSFIVNSKDTLNVYYYSTDVDYYVNYYFDGELQEDISYKKSASVGSTITLKDIDKVKDNIYFLEEDKEYSIKLSGEEKNIIDIYYVSYDMNYNVNVYLDDIYYQSHSFIEVAKRGSEVVLDNLEKTINVFTLDEREYKLSVSENSQLNYINVYYYSENYNTKYQDIDTTGKFYISFHWTDIKELFNLKGNYTQTEQFIIVYVVNILFYVIVCVFGYFGLKMLYKLFSFVKMF